MGKIAATLQQRKGNKSAPADSPYVKFDSLDGSHPWMQAVPEGQISYPVRELNHGKVTYFNFQLAKEMGLIDKDHPNQLNKKLEERLLKTFAIRIINEYDQAHNILYPKHSIKKNKYMATRYLQLQHDSKCGRTSGDGRCIWNGIIEHDGNTWDINSRGTGVTALAPGVVEAGKPLRTGNTQFGYGCGLAEMDELLGASIMAEIFHQNGIETERVLCVIDLGRGMGIGVRAAKNLIRPAHLFLYLKQNQWENLKSACDYFIERQIDNRELKVKRGPTIYQSMLDTFAEKFAQFAATLDRDYIFAWLDWDGDNVLASGGIIDYGSIRQFGLRHDQYRYDDIQRFSTNLNEQKIKARQIVQVFAQMVDYIDTKKKKSLESFANHPACQKFDLHFKRYQLDRFLYHLGMSRQDRDLLLSQHLKSVQNFFETYSYLEGVKTQRKTRRVADGINRPAIFSMRNISRELPGHFLQQKDLGLMPLKTFYKIILASTASHRDKKAKFNRKIRSYLKRFQLQYRNLVIKTARKNEDHFKVLARWSKRSQALNREDRLTGNGLVNIVLEILKHRKSGVPDSEIQKVMDEFIQTQISNPDLSDRQSEPWMSWSDRSKELMSKILTVVEGFKDDI